MAELLVLALGGPRTPVTIADLHRVLHRWSHAGDAAEKLARAVREHSTREPNTTLDELERRYQTAG